MLFLLSPAKALDFDTPLPPALAELPFTRAHFTPQARELTALLKELSPQQVAGLMGLSDALAALNVARYQAFWARATERNARAAVLAFNGDVYGGFDARSLQPDDLLWAQQHLCILSGLYGVLRPLDLMQAYRLEMGTRLATPLGTTLYRYWGRRIADELNRRQKPGGDAVVVNLASQEYFKSVDLKALRAPVLECVFQEERGGQYQVVSFNAKRARGLMARFATLQRVVRIEQLQGFDLEGYAFDAAASGPWRYVFRRSVA